MDPFLQNHQYNFVARQVKFVISTSKTCTDPQVVEMVKYTAGNKMVQACPGLDGENLHLLEHMGKLQTDEELQSYLNTLSQCIIPFPEITETQLKRLFPKVKKLSMPELSDIKGQPLTYLTWTDTATNKKYLVYYRRPQQGKELGRKLIGLEGKFTITSKSGVCAFCKKPGNSAFFSVLAKMRGASSPDNYRTVGQYICLDSKACNSQITELDGLESFIETITH